MLSLNSKRKLFWGSLIVTTGSTIGAYFFPPLMVLSLTSLVMVAGSYFAIDSELSHKISTMREPIALEDLVNTSFPKDTQEKRKLIHKNTNKTRVQTIKDVADETWAKHVFFTEEAKKAKGSKKDSGSNDNKEDSKTTIIPPQTDIIDANISLDLSNALETSRITPSN